VVFHDKFTRRAVRKLGLEGRYYKWLDFYRQYLSNGSSKCMPNDVLFEFNDSLFTPIIENTRQLAFGYRVDDKINYYFRRYLRANDLWGFVRDVLGKSNYVDADALNTDNSGILPVLFGYSIWLCTVCGTSCGSSAPAPCTCVKYVNGVGYCNTVSTEFSGTTFSIQDTAPYRTNYIAQFGISAQVPASGNTAVITGGVTIPGCFPSSGVAVQLLLDGNVTNCGSTGGCTSSCPSGTAGCGTNVYACPNQSSFTTYSFPLLYYNINYVVYPNSAYSFWLQYSIY